MIAIKNIDRHLMSAASAIVNHWWLIVNGVILLFILPIILYPLFMSTGNPVLVQIAGAILSAYHTTCHQLPSRSLFIFGYQMAVCSRCFAIYVSFLATGIFFYFIKDRLKPWSIKYYVLFCVPMAIDGLSQLVGFRESTNELRIITGIIFGIGSALYVYPYLNAILEIEKEDQKRLNVKLEAMTKK